MDPQLVERVREMLIKSVSTVSSYDRKWAVETAIELEKSEPFLIPICLELAKSDINNQIYFLAISFVKNSIARLWHKMDLDIRDIVKEQLVEVLLVSHHSGTRGELGLIIRKISRFEFPSKWPALIEFLKSVDFRNEGACYILNQVVKEQESKRLMAQRKETVEFMPSLLERLLPIWLSNSPVTTTRSWKYFETAILRLLRISFHSINDLPAAVRDEIINRCLQRFESQSVDGKKFVKNFAKLFIEDFSAFSREIFRIGSVCMYRLMQGGDEYITQYIICILNKIASSSMENVEISAEFYRVHPLMSQVGISIHRGLTLRQGDIEEWIQSPDESIDGPLDGSELREVVLNFLETSDTLDQSIGRRLLADFLSSSSIDEGSMDALLVAITHLYKNIREPSLVSKMWSKLLGMNGSNSAVHILFKYRVTQIIKRGIECCDFSQSDLLELINFLCNMASSNAVALRIGSVACIKYIYDKFSDWENWDQFTTRIVGISLQLLKEVESSDVAWRLLNIIRIFVQMSPNDFMGEKISENIFEQFLQLFQKSKNDELIRFAVIDLCASLIGVLRPPVGARICGQMAVKLLEESLKEAISAGDDEFPSNLENTIDTLYSLLIASVRALNNIESFHMNILPLLDPIITQLVPACIRLEIYPAGLIELLIELDCYCIETSSSTEALRIRDQLQIVNRFYLQSNCLSESVADDCLELLQLISIKFLDRVDVEFVWPMVQFSAACNVDIDNSPLPFDSLVILLSIMANSEGRVHVEFWEMIGRLSIDERFRLGTNVWNRMSMLGLRKIYAISFLLDLGIRDLELSNAARVTVQQIGHHPGDTCRKRTMNNVVPVWKIVAQIETKLDSV